MWLTRRDRRGGLFVSAADDPIDDVAGRHDLGLGELVEDRRARSSALDETGGPEYAEMLAGVREGDADCCGEIADGACAAAQGVQEHQALGIRQYLADVRVHPVVVGIAPDRGFAW